MQETLRKYNNRAIETSQVIEELIQMAKDFQAEMAREASLGLNPDEIAFYDALANNESAVRELVMIRSSKLPERLPRSCANQRLWIGKYGTVYVPSLKSWYVVLYSVGSIHLTKQQRRLS